VLRGDLRSTSLAVEFLEIVSMMLKAVVFYLIGVGLYSLFIAPLNLPLALGIESFNDLEAKVVSAIVVIMAVTFLEHFILWQQPGELVPMGIMLAVLILALVAYQVYSHWAKAEQYRSHARPQERARQHLFQRGEEYEGRHAARRSPRRQGRAR
jgi:uncharacterized membrane protein YqhA